MGHIPREHFNGFFMNEFKNRVGVYAIYDIKGNMIYVGETADLRTRVYQHVMSSSFGYMMHRIDFYELTVEDRKAIEFIIIDICKPVFNNYNEHKMRYNKYTIIKDYDAEPYICTCKACMREMQMNNFNK